MSVIGHNGGPSVEPGATWRKTCWRAAREALLPVLPIEVVRLRVRRAAELGLDYRTYAGVRATTGHDIVAFLFSTNALALLRRGDRLDETRKERLAAICGAGRIVAVHAPFDPAAVAGLMAACDAPAESAGMAPGLADGWRGTGDRIAALLRPGGRAPDRVVLVGATMLEREWVAAARLAGHVPADRYFAAPAQPV